MQVQYREELANHSVVPQARATAARELKTLLEDNAPYNARVTFESEGRGAPSGTSGWSAPDLSPWLENALNAESQTHYGAPRGVTASRPLVR